MKKYFLLLCISFYLGQLDSYGQDLKVGEKTYLISSKRQINSDVEYLKLKEKSAKNSKAESFIRVNKVVSKTIFSETEIKYFLTNGTISSLGRVIEKKIKIKGKSLNLKYIKKGKLQVLFHIEKEKLQIREYDTDFVDRNRGASSAKAKSRTDQGWLNCRTGCDLALIDCSVDVDACGWLWDECMEACNAIPVTEGPATGRPRPPVAYFIPIKNTAIKLN